MTFTVVSGLFLLKEAIMQENYTYQVVKKMGLYIFHLSCLLQLLRTSLFARGKTSGRKPILFTTHLTTFFLNLPSFELQKLSQKAILPYERGLIGDLRVVILSEVNTLGVRWLP